jgi:hypothetical protein
MRLRVWGAACVIAIGGLAAAGNAAGQSHPANVNWPTYLPAMPSPAEIQPGSVPYCRTPSVRCVDTEIRRMRRLQRDLGCDHRAVFATTYLELTRQLREDLSRAGLKKQLIDPRYLYTEDALFANIYFDSYKADKRGRDVPDAWRIAFDTARRGEVMGAQDMLLGINAHVQNDMPYVLAALGLVTRDGRSRKPDHDLINVTSLDRAYERVVKAVADRYDPSAATTNAPWHPGDNVAGLEMVKQWRERVWRNAERLVNARSHEERQAVSADIEWQAAEWARGIAAFQEPGARERRAAYCRERLGR